MLLKVQTVSKLHHKAVESSNLETGDSFKIVKRENILTLDSILSVDSSGPQKNLSYDLKVSFFSSLQLVSGTKKSIKVI